MTFTISSYCDVAARAKALALNAPDQLAILPRNFETAATTEGLLHESTAQTVRILFRENNIHETPLEREKQRIPCIQENNFALVLPTLFVGSLILSENAHLLSVALSVIAGYATDFFKGIPGRRNVKLSVVVEDKTKKASKIIHYEGDIDGLKDISDIAGKVFTNDGSD